MKNKKTFFKKKPLIIFILSIILGFFFWIQLGFLNKEFKDEEINIKQISDDSIEQKIEIQYFRNKDVDLDIFKKFQETSSIKVDLLNKSNQIENSNKMHFESFEYWIEQIKNNDSASYYGDLVVFNSIDELNEIIKNNLLASIDIGIPLIEKQIPENFKSKNKDWFGLVQEPIIIIYNKDKITPKKDHLENYEDLANPKWKGKLIVPSSQVAFVKSLVAYMIRVNGKEKTIQWAKDVMKNLSQNPISNEDLLFKALSEQKGELTLFSRSNFFKQFISDNSSTTASKKILDPSNPYRILRPNQNAYGTHVDIGGIGILKNTKHKKNSIKFLRYVTDTQTQWAYKHAHPHEIPIKMETKDDQVKASVFHVEEIIASLEEAIYILKAVGWN